LISFVKAHACGNDFLIVEATSLSDKEKGELAIRLCARNTGVGADGVEYLDWTGDRSARIRLFNADGTIAEISGNGTRCVAAWIAHSKQAAPGDSLALETDAGMRRCLIVEAASPHLLIATGMGVPVVSKRVITLVDGIEVSGAVVSMGNPHFVIFVESDDFSIAGSSWEALGRDICFHPDFPRQTNVEFVRVLDADQIQIRIFERGVGPTTSSGTGTCAAGAASIALRDVSRELVVHAPGGSQKVSWSTPESEMTLIGPADLIATGEAFG
jgi:diaminopimelate epimerase